MFLYDSIFRELVGAAAVSLSYSCSCNLWIGLRLHVRWEPVFFLDSRPFDPLLYTPSCQAIFDLIINTPQFFFPYIQSTGVLDSKSQSFPCWNTTQKWISSFETALSRSFHAESQCIFFSIILPSFHIHDNLSEYIMMFPNLIFRSFSHTWWHREFVLHS